MYRLRKRFQAAKRMADTRQEQMPTSSPQKGSPTGRICQISTVDNHRLIYSWEASDQRRVQGHRLFRRCFSAYGLICPLLLHPFQAKTTRLLHPEGDSLQWILLEPAWPHRSTRPRWMRPISLRAVGCFTGITCQLRLQVVVSGLPIKRLMRATRTGQSKLAACKEISPTGHMLTGLGTAEAPIGRAIPEEAAGRILSILTTDPQPVAVDER
jgi:hypothetical protein